MGKISPPNLHIFSLAILSTEIRIPIFDISKCSSLYRLFRVSAYMIQFLKRLEPHPTSNFLKRHFDFPPPTSSPSWLRHWKILRKDIMSQEYGYDCSVYKPYVLI